MMTREDASGWGFLQCDDSTASWTGICRILAIACWMDLGIVANATGSAAESRTTFVRNQSVVANVDGYWSAHIANAGLPTTSPAVEHYEEVMPTDCGLATPGADPFYCQVDQTVYLDVRSIELLVDSFGETAIVIAVAHEWGHYIDQAIDTEEFTGSAQRLGGTSTSTVSIELVADCLAGVFVKGVSRSPEFSHSDIEAMETLFLALGDEVHSTGEELDRAFHQRYDHAASPSICSAYAS